MHKIVIYLNCEGMGKLLGIKINYWDSDRLL